MRAPFSCNLSTHSSSSAYTSGRHAASARQQGIALAVSLVFLLILTLLAVVSMNTGVLQEKMAGNTRDIDIAFQSAESALRFGERTLSGLSSISGQTFPVCANNANNIWCFGGVDWTNLTWWKANSMTYMADAAKQISEAFEDPRATIEQMAANSGLAGAEVDDLNVPTSGGKSGAKYYRITARGVGVSGVSEAVTESYYRIHKPQL